MKEKKIRFNFIDVLLILVIAAVVFALLYIFVLSENKNEVVASTEQTTIRYVIQATGVDEQFDGLAKVGDPAEESVVRKNIGTVIGVQSEPNKKVTFDYENGRETVSEVDGRVTVNLTIEATATESDTAFSVNGCDIRVGQQYSVALPDVFLSGYCIELTADTQN